MRIECHTAIEGEPGKIIKYYNECSGGLGTEFLNEFEHQVFKIAVNPLRWVAVKGNIRRSVMHRFPYGAWVTHHIFSISSSKSGCRSMSFSNLSSGAGGLVSPRSYRENATLPTPNDVASCACVSFSFLRMRRMSAAGSSLIAHTSPS